MGEPYCGRAITVRHRRVRGRSRSLADRDASRDCLGDDALVRRAMRANVAAHDWIVAIGIVRPESIQIAKHSRC
jgi:hypothetical protein